MLKLLLGHWQAHREPLSFVLTDDPLYCSHLTKSPFPEVYSVNRVNPIFEDEEEETKSVSSSVLLKRSLSEQRRENETRASDDTGYSSCSHPKSLTTADSLTDDVVSLEARHMSSDSDEGSQPEAVVVSADVHRVSYPEDVIVLSSSDSSSHSQTFSANSYFGGSSETSQDPFDSLTMSSTVTENATTSNGYTQEVKKPNSAVRERLQKLLEKGNDRTEETYLDSLEVKPSNDQDIERTKNDLMKSLTRALSSKVPNKTGDLPSNSNSVTRTDSALDINARLIDRKSTSSSTIPKMLNFSNKSTTNGVTRQDESSGSSTSSYAKPRKYQQRATKHKDHKRESITSAQESSDSKKSHKCKLCENVHRPLAFHQLLPGHWSYDNLYLPQITRGVCCSCVHCPSFPHSSEDDVFYHPLYYPPDIARARHSWAPYPEFPILEKRRTSSEDKSASTSAKENDGVKVSQRCSPDGSSRETDSSDSGQLKKSLSERRSLREPKKCKCDHCLTTSVLDKDKSNLEAHACPCCSHRRVKFASDTDLSQHKHIHSPPFRVSKDKLVNGEPISAAYVMNLPHINNHILNGGQPENGSKTKKVPPMVPRGLKEPIKMDELYRTYPINFREWETNYRRSYLQKRRKRALNMVGMAIGIVFVVGIAVALTFVFLRIKRPV